VHTHIVSAVIDRLLVIRLNDMTLVITGDTIMSNIAFHQLPRASQITVALTWILSWLGVAEWVIDREGWDRALLGYRAAQLCVWDVAVIAIIALIVVYAARKPRAATTKAVHHEVR
jgi:hypothetical protein